MKKMGYLALADGSVFSGGSLTECDPVVGELVFSTSTCGYPEILTDPSYYNQIVVLAHPEVGNYGVNFSDLQSSGIKVTALVVRNLSQCASSFRSEMTLADWLLRENIPVIFGIDTRALISHIRDAGTMMAAMSSKHYVKVDDLFNLAKSAKPIGEVRQSFFVSVSQPETFCETRTSTQGSNPKKKHCIVVMDFGVKRALLRYLAAQNTDIILVPGDISPEEIWLFRPDGLFLSNGPGDPQLEKSAIETVRAFLGKLPIFGVCLGHQILALALGLSTYKLKFGHRGSNHAVKRSEGNIITTAQNHGYAVKDVTSTSISLKEDINIADGTNEGIDLPHLHAFSVQFHPEGAPGPLDSLSYFEKFMTYIAEWKKSQTSDGYASAHEAFDWGSLVSPLPKP